jgi:hypothetical protein
MKLVRLALCAAIGLFSMAAFAQNAVTVVVPGAPVAAGATGNAIVRLAGIGIAGASFRLCYSTTILTPGAIAIPTVLPGLSCNAPTAGNCPVGTNQGISCAGFAPAGTWMLPQEVTVPFTVAANATGTNTPLAFGTPAPNYADNNGNDITPTAAGANFPIAGVVTTPPNLTYAPTTAAGVTFPSGVAGAAVATITATPSGGSGIGAGAATTLNTCTPSAGFTVTNAPIDFSFVGNATVAQTIQLACTRGVAAQTGTLACSEQQAAGASVTRTWNLTCPQAVVIAGPPIAYAPAPPGPVAFGNVTIAANAVSNIVATPSGGAGGGTTTLGACAITGADAAQFALVSATTLTFTAGTTTPQNLGVRFTPALPVGTKIAALACTETVQSGATTIRFWNLTGVSVQAPPQFSANPAPPGPVAFGPVIVGQAASRTIVVTNPAAAGAANLPLTGCTLANAPGVVVSPTSLNLAPGASGNLALTFTPGSVSTLSNATLTCTDPLVLEATRTWNLTGEGVQPTAVPTLGDFGLWAMLGLMLGTGLVIVGTRKQ